jgi:hypothetical protein
MNKSLGIQLIVYGLLLAGLSYLVHLLCPGLAQPTLITGLVGGALSLAWGVRTTTGSHGKTLPILTLIPVNFVLLSQVVLTWTSGGVEVAGRQSAAAAITVLLALSMGMLIRIAYAGQAFDSLPTSGAKATETRSDAAEKRRG